MIKRWLTGAFTALLTVGLVGLPAGAALADGEVTADPTTVYLTTAEKKAPGNIEFTSGCATGYNISWEFHAETKTDPGNTGWNPVQNDMTVDNTANAATLKIAKAKLNMSSSGRLYRAVCTKSDDANVKAYSKPAGMFWLELSPVNFAGQLRNIAPLPEFNVSTYQDYQVTGLDQSRQLAISTHLGNITIDPKHLYELGPGSIGQYWGANCTVSWKKEGAGEVATGFITNIPANGNTNKKIRPTVTCPGGKTLTVLDEEWARIVLGTDFSNSDVTKGYALLADSKWACIPDEAFDAGGKSTEAITYTWKVHNEDKGEAGELIAKIQLKEQKTDPKEGEWSDADNLWVGTYQGSSANPKWTWAAGSKHVPAYLTFDNDAHTITIKGATKKQLRNYWLRILFIHTKDSHTGLAPAPMWASSYAATRQTHPDRTPEHPFDLETGDAVRDCENWKLDGDRDDGLNIPRDVNNHRAKGTGTPNDPYTLYVEPGKPIVNFTADNWKAKYDGPNRFLHYYTRWDIFNEETKQWEPYRVQDLNATDSYLNVPRSKFKNGTKFRAYLADRIYGGYVYFVVTEVGEFPEEEKLAKTGVENSTLPIAFAGLGMFVAGLALVGTRRRFRA